MFGRLREFVGRLPRQFQVWRRARRARSTFDRELALLPILVERSESAVDIGAHLGVYTWPLSRLSRKVYAIEPNPELARRLRASFGRRVEVLQCALSDSQGSATLRIPKYQGRELLGRSSLEFDANREFEHREIEVPLRTLDSLELTDCGFIKAHIEGHELAVFQGGKRTLERLRPTILASAQVRFGPDDPDRLNRFLAELGYRGYFLEQDRLRPFACFDPLVHQRPETVKKPGERDLKATYIYNFLYVHPARAAVLDRLSHMISDELSSPTRNEPPERKLANSA
jgi:FkbM family methyltransferase